MAQATACTKLELAVPSETSQSQGEKYRLMHFCVTPRVNLAGAGSRMQAGGNGELAFAGIELQFGVTGKFWRRTVVARAEHSASGRYLLSLNCHPKMAGRVTFVYYIRTKKKKNPRALSSHRCEKASVERVHAEPRVHSRPSGNGSFTIKSRRGGTC